MKKLIKNYVFVIFMFITIIYGCGGALNKSESKGSTSDDMAIVESAKSDESPSVVKSKSADGSDAPAGESETESKSEVDVDKAPVDDQAQVTQENLLTAGEWNDLNNWDFWKNLMDSAWSETMTTWKFYPINKFSVTVKNKSGQLLTNVKVSLTDIQGLELWSAKTDNFGKAELWANIFEGKSSQFTIKAVADNGVKKEISNIKLTDSKQEIVFDCSTTKNKILDLMFVVDVTGSMGDELEFLKTELKNIINKVEKQNNELEIRVGLVFYRDHEDEFIVRDFDFETDLTKIQSNIAAQSAGGGGDFEEAVDEALDAAVNKQDWSDDAIARLCFLILDAPPHYGADNISLMQKVTKSAANQGIKIIPTVASGIDKNTEFLMRFLSCATNGTYVFLTDDSGIGESHLAPTTGKYEVEFLNDLITRLIMKYTNTTITK